MWKITLDIFRMLSRENETMYELNKQTNKQTNKLRIKETHIKSNWIFKLKVHINSHHFDEYLRWITLIDINKIYCCRKKTSRSYKILR
jgi:hypothetical protein